MKKTPSDFVHDSIKSALDSYNELKTKPIKDSDYCNIYYIDGIEIHFYRNAVSCVDINKCSNVVILFKNKEYQILLNFKYIDIFNDRVLILDNSSSTKLCTEIIYKDYGITDIEYIDEGLIFQLQTIFPIMPLSVEDLKNIYIISNKIS